MVKEMCLKYTHSLKGPKCIIEDSKHNMPFKSLIPFHILISHCDSLSSGHLYLMWAGGVFSGPPCINYDTTATLNYCWGGKHCWAGFLQEGGHLVKVD